MASFCLDCLADVPERGARCRDCGSPRLARHAELLRMSIAHVDCDAFYAAIEKRDDPSLADQPVIVLGLTSDLMTLQQLDQYADLNLAQRISMLPDVGQVVIFGSADYAMRIWVKPDLLAKLGLAVPDLARAIEQQSAVNPAGQVGAAPGRNGAADAGAASAPPIAKLANVRMASTRMVDARYMTLSPTARAHARTPA